MAAHRAFLVTAVNKGVTRAHLDLTVIRCVSAHRFISSVTLSLVCATVLLVTMVTTVMQSVKQGNMVQTVRGSASVLITVCARAPLAPVPAHQDTLDPTAISLVQQGGMVKTVHE